MSSPGRSLLPLLAFVLVAPSGVLAARPQADAPAFVPQPRSTVIKQVMPSNVRVSVEVDGRAVRSATGVVIASKKAPGETIGYVLTNAHVVSMEPGADVVYEVLVDRRGLATLHLVAKVVATGQVPDEDLALLEVHGLDVPAARFADDDEMEVGDEVVAVGAPFGRGLSVSSGIVSQLEWEPGENAPSRFKTDAPIGYGASGGGIYRVPDGKLLALVEGYRTAKVSVPGGTSPKKPVAFDIPMPGETFAAPVAKIRRFLATRGHEKLLERTKTARAEERVPESGGGFVPAAAP